MPDRIDDFDMLNEPSPTRLPVTACEKELRVGKLHARRFNWIGMTSFQLRNGRRITGVDRTEEVLCLVSELIQVRPPKRQIAMNGHDEPPWSTRSPLASGEGGSNEPNRFLRAWLRWTQSFPRTGGAPRALLECYSERGAVQALERSPVFMLVCAVVDISSYRWTLCIVLSIGTMITLRVFAFVFLVTGPAYVRAQTSGELAGLEYRAKSVITGVAPAALETRITLFNRGSKPLRIEYGACALTVHAFRTPASASLHRTSFGTKRPDYMGVTFTVRNTGTKSRRLQPEGSNGCLPMTGYNARSSRDTHYLWLRGDWIARPCPIELPEMTLQPGETRTFRGGTNRTGSTNALYALLLGGGLWDAHVHLSFYGPTALDSLKAHNVAAVRDLGANNLDEILRWRDEIAAGTRKGPRIFTAGVILDGPKEDSANRWTLRTEADAAHAVDSLARRGVDFIKTHNGLSRPVYFAILRAAKAHNLKVASHIPQGVPAWEAADSGASSIEHAAESMMASPIYAGYATAFDEAVAWWKSPAGFSAIGRLKRSGVYFTPTLALYAANVNLPTDSAARVRRREALSSLVELTRLMHKAGIPIMAGSDIAVQRQDYRPGQALKEEMSWLRRAGLSEYEVKHAAGENVARWLGQQ